MTQGVAKTLGTRLYFAVSDTDIHKVACPTGIQGLGGNRAQLDVTCLDSETMEYLAGLDDPQQVTVPINYIANSEAHQALEDLFDSGAVISWMVVLPDQDSAPTTLDTNDRLVSPGPTTWEFLAYVANLEFDFQVNEVQRATLTLQRTSAIVRNRASADLA